MSQDNVSLATYLLGEASTLATRYDSMTEAMKNSPLGTAIQVAAKRLTDKAEKELDADDKEREAFANR